MADAARSEMLVSSGKRRDANARVLKPVSATFTFYQYSKGCKVQYSKL